MCKSILFVCLGNICRSPTAEGVARSLAAQSGLSCRFDSAGTADWHHGRPPYPPMQAAASQRGYDISGLRARPVRVQDFNSADRIIAMDGENLRDLQVMAPANSRATLHLLTDYAPDAGQDHIPDPYYTRDFDGALDLIEICVKGVLRQLS